MQSFEQNNFVIEHSSEQQRSLEWYRRRLGYITGSEVSKIIGKGRGKEFSDTAQTYLETKAAERCIDERVLNDDALLQDYIEVTSVYTSRAMQRGIDNEEHARRIFSYHIAQKILTDVGSCRHNDIEYFAASPDGYFVHEESGTLCTVEIKCPKEATFAHYVRCVRCAADLKAVKPEYYWQIMAQLSCTGAKRAYFVVYSEFTLPFIYWIEIERDDSEIAALEARVKQANEDIDNIVQILLESSRS